MTNKKKVEALMSCIVAAIREKHHMGGREAEEIALLAIEKAEKLVGLRF